MVAVSAAAHSVWLAPASLSKHATQSPAASAVAATDEATAAALQRVKDEAAKATAAVW